MKLTVLGCGPSIPHPKRSPSALWLEMSGGTLLMDCSGSAPLRMAQEGCDWRNLDAIWISHFHLDHCAGLLPFLAGTKHDEQMKKRTKPLKLVGPPGFRKLIDGFNGVNNYRLLEQPFPVEIVEVETLEKFEIVPGVEAVTAKTPHTPESHAIHLRDGDGKTLVYTADTAFEPSLAALANRVDLFILECTYVRDKPVKKHLELSEAVFLIRKSAARRAMLTHFYPDWDDVNFGEELAKFSPGCEVLEARDGLRVEI